MDLKRFEDYKAEVILAYKKKKNEGTLTRNLRHHTPANLKKECLAFFQNRYSDKDSEIFRELFNKGTNAGEFLKIIEESNPDIFRPLNNFLRKNTDSGTHNRNIELLAWLIDFEPRPHRYVDFYRPEKAKENSSSDKTKPDTDDSKTLQGNPVNEEPVKPEIITEQDDDELKEPGIIVESGEKSNEPKVVAVPENTGTVTNEQPHETIDNQYDINKKLGIPRKFNKTIIAFFATFVILSGSYVFYDKSKQKCMYWDIDHYQAIPCDQKVDGATIVALDTFRLDHLKKIKNKAVITRNGVGKIHYSKVKGKVEFYTTGGENPEDSRKRLLPMSEHMYETYILNKQ